MTAATTPLADRQIALLDELSQIGMTAARSIGSQITAIAPDETPASPEAIAALESLTRAYSKIARAIRLTVQLQDKIARPAAQSAEHAWEPIIHIVRTSLIRASRAAKPSPPPVKGASASTTKATQRPTSSPTSAATSASTPNGHASPPIAGPITNPSPPPLAGRWPT